MAYLIYISTIFLINAIQSLSLNLVLGFTGLISAMHIVFVGMGAYSTAILATRFGMNFFETMLAGIVVSAVASCIVGLILSRLEGDYYLLGTVGFNYIIYSLALNLEGITRGPLGIPAVPRPNIGSFSFLSNVSFLWLTLFFALITYMVSRRTADSSFGRVIRGIRDDETAVQIFGYNTVSYKVGVFAIAAVLASISGSLYASYISYYDPTNLLINESIFILAMVVLGGLASHRGAILGALILTLAPELFRFVGFSSEIAGQMRQVLYGSLLTLLMLYRPQGLMGKYKL